MTATILDYDAPGWLAARAVATVAVAVWAAWSIRQEARR